MSEIDYYLSSYRLIPAVFIRYQRLAYISAQDDLRITFDTDIAYRYETVNFSSDQGQTINQTENKCLMKIKSGRNFPLWLAKELSSSQIYHMNFSKYGTTYKEYRLGE